MHLAILALLLRANATSREAPPPELVGTEVPPPDWGLNGVGWREYPEEFEAVVRAGDTTLTSRWPLGFVVLEMQRLTRRVTLAPGASAHMWARSTTVMGVGLVTSTVVALVLILTTNQGWSESPFVAVSFFTAMVLACTCPIVAPMLGRSFERETAAGYTTLRHSRLELDEVDPRTGFVVRDAGEPYLTPEIRQERLQAIHAENGAAPAWLFAGPVDHNRNGQPKSASTIRWGRLVPYLLGAAALIAAALYRALAYGAGALEIVLPVSSITGAVGGGFVFLRFWARARDRKAMAAHLAKKHPDALGIVIEKASPTDTALRMHPDYARAASGRSSEIAGLALRGTRATVIDGGRYPRDAVSLEITPTPVMATASIDTNIKTLHAFRLSFAAQGDPIHVLFAPLDVVESGRHHQLGYEEFDALIHHLAHTTLVTNEGGNRTLTPTD